MEAPAGYPPPTLIRRRRRFGRMPTTAALLILALVLGTCTLGRSLEREPLHTAVPDQGRVQPRAPDPVAAPAMIVEGSTHATVAVQPSIDARKPNRWYYVARLGDGPGAIYSRDGGQWNFAFACDARTRMIEFIAVGTGSPGDFDQQALRVGNVRLLMDATYARDSGGTISMKLPAAHPFLNALDGRTPMEVQLMPTHKTLVPVDAAVVRLVRACRGRA
ncbi:hypothetical protein [Rhizorhabdus argentea]|uniref:hypothetical protein n=1 Tax=Rhizorhabdus argentea TaxID=1387174 RepID=UPI0030EB8DF2